MLYARLLSLLVFITACALALIGCGKVASRSKAPTGTIGTHAGFAGDAPPAEAYGGDGGPVHSDSADYDAAPEMEQHVSAGEPSRRARRDDRREARREPHTPGLGTSYGEHHHSRVVTTPFHRDSSSPDVVLSMFYNDWEGLEAMSAAYGHRTTTSSTAQSSDGAFSVSLIDEHGRTLPATDVDGQRYAAGAAGARYQIRISNNTAYRFEVVSSVDGLDVIDGSDAGYHKRGYILDPWSAITIDGWRTSDNSVAAFRFSDIEDSYAARTGRPRNVGVVGVAFFHERGTAPWEELRRRHSSDPFPGYAPPPPPRWR